MIVVLVPLTVEDGSFEVRIVEVSELLLVDVEELDVNVEIADEASLPELVERPLEVDTLYVVVSVCVIVVSGVLVCGRLNDVV
jgi:hypothetical protein